MVLTTYRSLKTMSLKKVSTWEQQAGHTSKDGEEPPIAWVQLGSTGNYTLLITSFNKMLKQIRREVIHWICHSALPDRGNSNNRQEDTKLHTMFNDKEVLEQLGYKVDLCNCGIIHIREGGSVMKATLWLTENFGFYLVGY